MASMTAHYSPVSCLLMLVTAVVWSILPVNSTDSLERTYGRRIDYRLYDRLMTMPVPGERGATFHYDELVTAYSYRNSTGCSANDKFYPLFSTWTENGTCRVFECLPNNTTDHRDSFFVRKHHCGPQGPKMLPSLCHYTDTGSAARKELSPFPDCCPLYTCSHNYDARRLMLSEQSPTQGRQGNEVFETAFSPHGTSDSVQVEVHSTPQNLTVITTPFKQINFGSLNTLNWSLLAINKNRLEPNRSPFTATPTGNKKRAKTLGDILG